MNAFWGTLPAWITAVVAFFASVTAIRQLRLSTGAQRDQVQIARANLLLTIDKAFEGDEIYRSRKSVRSLRNRAEAKVDRAPGKKRSPEARKAQIAEEFSHQVNELWATARSMSDEDVETPTSPKRIAHDRYAEMMGLLNWMETVGMLCKRNLLHTGDILDLYDQVVVPTVANFMDHIEMRRSEGPHVNPRFMENAFWLYERSLEYQKERDRTMPSDPAPSPTKWT